MFFPMVTKVNTKFEINNFCLLPRIRCCTVKFAALQFTLLSYKIFKRKPQAYTNSHRAYSIMTVMFTALTMNLGKYFYYVGNDMFTAYIE